MPTTTLGSSDPNNGDCEIRNVWASNLEGEFLTIRLIAQKCTYVAIDTEFPGVIVKPNKGSFRSSAEYHYETLRLNVNMLKIIQLGLTFLDENGNAPDGTVSTWQFNFKFDLQKDIYVKDSIDFLQKSGIQFKKHKEDGIEPLEFAKLLMSSGIVVMKNFKWLSFHSCYDFGYLIKLLTNRHLPEDEKLFFDMLRLYFTTIYDVKYLMMSCKSLKGGLQGVAEQLELKRIGPQHQAGSDSLLTGMTFFKIKEMFFKGTIDDVKFSGHLYGLLGSFRKYTPRNDYYAGWQGAR